MKHQQQARRPVGASLRSRLTRILPISAKTLVKSAIDYGKDIVARVDVLRLKLTDHRRPRSTTGHILIVDDLVPNPLFGAGFPRAFAIVQSLARAGYVVEFYPMRSDPEDVVLMRDKLGERVRLHHGGGARGLRRLLWRRGAGFSTIFISRPPPMLAFATSGWTPPMQHAPRIVYDAEAVLAPREARQRALFGEAWSSDQERNALTAELGLAASADMVTAVTPADRALIAAGVDVPVAILSHPVSPHPSTAPFDDRRDLLFVGRLTGLPQISPNVDSVLWFSTRIMPLLDRHIGTDYRLHLVGLFDSAEVMALASDRIVLHGSVEQLDSFYNTCRLFVAPTRYAAGLPLKVVEAMAQGLPCIGTPLLAEQVGVDGHGFAPDPSPETFADRCAMLYADRQRWNAARQHGIEHVSRNFSQNSFSEALERIFGPIPAPSSFTATL